MQAKILALKSIFMNQIYNLRQEISSVLSQLEWRVSRFQDFNEDIKNINGKVQRLCTS